jgi:hypothetical protein
MLGVSELWRAAWWPIIKALIRAALGWGGCHAANDDPAVLAAVGFVGVGRDGFGFAEGGLNELIVTHAVTFQITEDGGGPALGKAVVVAFGAQVTGVPFDQKGSLAELRHGFANFRVLPPGSLLGLSKLREGFGRSASLPPLMWQATKGTPKHEQALQHVITRPAVVKNRRTNIDYLERVDVLACGREDWHNLNDKILKNLPSHQKRSFDSMLADALEPLQEDYDL